MLIIRATKKVLKYLPLTAGQGATSDTALGDWYVNRLVIDRKPLLLFVSSKSRLAMLTPGRDVKNLPSRMADLVAARLKRLGTDQKLIDCEYGAMDKIAVGKTIDRSTTGQMVDFAKAIPYYTVDKQYDDSLALHIESMLGETPCNVNSSMSDVIWPTKDTLKLLEDKWG